MSINNGLPFVFTYATNCVFIDSVTRTVYYKYFHPKEVSISNGILNREINALAGKPLLSNSSKTDLSTSIFKKLPTSQRFGSTTVLTSGTTTTMGSGESEGLTFVYPFGATLNVQKPSIPVLSSGPMSFPLNRPIGAAYQKVFTFC